ncbi:hypothetical protein [Gluconacetobacter diazotrophicus]|uniref:hypothetical protein n=1 Tax=Gluconacetobacter diazotrophicus TaxID=33996 RepID=UPI00059BB41F|nr:hypothetical protein [Gluconacetobacter diazotrophicus]
MKNRNLTDVSIGEAMASIGSERRTEIDGRPFVTCHDTGVIFANVAYAAGMSRTEARRHVIGCAAQLLYAAFVTGQAGRAEAHQIMRDALAGGEFRLEELYRGGGHVPGRA